MFKYILNMFDLSVFKNQATGKAETTKLSILETALGLFRQKGFDATTMRDIASAGNMAVGTAYHHFESKETIVAAYYQLVQQTHAAQVQIFNTQKQTLKAKLEQSFLSKLEIVQHDQKLLGVIMRYIGDAEHPLSIFGENTADLRQAGIEMYQTIFASENLSQELRDLVPTAFWALHMGMLLYFLHDSSGGAKTRKLVGSALELALGVLKLTNQPLVQPLLKPVFKKINLLLREHQLMR